VKAGVAQRRAKLGIFLGRDVDADHAIDARLPLRWRTTPPRAVIGLA
jgi:hypothetical protein